MKPAEFKQANPKDQQITVVSTLEGHLSNLEDKIITPEQFAQKVQPLIEQLKYLATTQPNYW